VIGWLRGKRTRDDDAAAVGPPGLPLFSAAGPPPRIRPITPVVWVPEQQPPQVTLEEAGGDPVELCAAVTCALPAALWFTNDPDRPGDLQRRRHSGGEAMLPPIRLVRLPLDTVVFGGGHFLTACGDCFLAEQFPPNASSDYGEIDAMAPFDDLPVVEINDDVLLAGRFGAGSWGQWMCELLPKIVLAERAFPGRFAFLLPADITQAPPTGIWSNIGQTLEACGIPLSRVMAAAPDVTYRFSALHAVTPVWSDHIMHPGAAASVREACASIPAGMARRLAIYRDRQAGRVLNNASEIDAVLHARGFVAVPGGTLPFADQVAAFKGAATIFAVLGSDLANLIFAPAGVRVITAAPEPDHDRFSYGLVLDRRGRMADLRGPVVEARDSGEHSVFTLDPAALLVALDTMPG
jgi:hypothetical protein